MQTRQLSLDVFRGLTVAAMLLVNNPGRWGTATQYSQLRHAAWNGVTFTDLVFPFFLFVVGISLTLSTARRSGDESSRAEIWTHVLRRSGILIALGLFQNRFGILLAGGLFDLGSLLDARIPSVLFRIGLCYLLGMLLHTALKRTRSLLAAFVALLLGYGVLLKYLPIPGFGSPDLEFPLRDSSGVYHAVFSNLCSWVDTQVLGIRCLHHLSEASTGHLIWAFDPEGLLSTLGALATTLLGVVVGRLWIRERAAASEAPSAAIALPTPARWILAALGLLLLGWITSWWIPWNKRLWTPSYVLWTGGFAVLILSALRYLLDSRRWRYGYEPFEWYGRNAITAFFYSSLAATLSIHLSIPFGPDSGMPLKRFVYERMLASWAGPLHGSLLYAILVVIAWGLICGEMHRRRYYWKI